MALAETLQLLSDAMLELPFAPPSSKSGSDGWLHNDCLRSCLSRLFVCTCLLLFLTISVCYYGLLGHCVVFSLSPELLLNILAQEATCRTLKVPKIAIQ